MKFKVKTVTGTLHEIDATPSDSIEYLKKNLVSMTNIPKENQKLIFGTQLLNDDLSIKDINIHEGDIIVLLKKKDFQNLLQQLKIIHQSLQKQLF